MSDHDSVVPTAPAVRSKFARLVESLQACATPIDFADLERRGALRKAKYERGCWCLMLNKAAVPAHVWQQTTGAGQTWVGGRFVPMLSFSKSTNKKAAVLLEKMLSLRTAKQQ